MALIKKKIVGSGAAAEARLSKALDVFTTAKLELQGALDDMKRLKQAIFDRSAELHAELDANEAELQVINASENQAASSLKAIEKFLTS